MSSLPNLHSIEKNTFPVISKVVNSLLNKSSFKFVLGDSTCIRAYTSFKRDLEDVDLIFPGDTSIRDLNLFIQQHLNISSEEEIVYIDSNNKVGAFLRTRIAIPTKYKNDSNFIVDFHVGGSVFYKIFSCEVDHVFFSNTSIRTIQSVSGLEEVRIPVPQLEEVFLFKLHKFINFDQVDIISLLLENTLESDYIIERAEFYNIRKLHENLSYLLSNLKTLQKLWNVCHGLNYREKNFESLENKIITLKKLLE